MIILVPGSTRLKVIMLVVALFTKPPVENHVVSLPRLAKTKRSAEFKKRATVSLYATDTLNSVSVCFLSKRAKLFITPDNRVLITVIMTAMKIPRICEITLLAVPEPGTATPP